jgi:U3 small nucleolar RNA-associated protein 3
MAKKRKASSQAAGQSKRTAPALSSKLNIQTYEDVADSEDEFLINRDKILLDEGPEAKRRRKVMEDGIFRRMLKLTPLIQGLRGTS